MCGIAGVFLDEPSGVSPYLLLRMAGAIRHRGPDGYGFYAGSRVGLAHVRLSIIDPALGAQPLANEDGSILITYNGEVYNHLELRVQLEKRGHRFRTRCDTEVLVHAYEEWGPAMLARLNGQFAFAIYDSRKECLFLARDRFGVRPLFYTMKRGRLYFASEAKAIFASGEVEAEPDLKGMNEVFTFWSARAPRTPYREVFSLEPGTCAIFANGRLDVRRYYAVDYPEAAAEADDSLAALDRVMREGVDLRMRSDVPVGAYLSGGLDSTVICALAGRRTPHELRTFSVVFDDPRFDESSYQELVAAEIHSQHRYRRIEELDIADVFQEVIRHTETPLVRTGPAPLFLLSRLTRQHGIKVVLTGEGADELFLGYDLFKETRVRRFCERQPGSAWRSRLFDRLYPYLGSGQKGGEFWRRSFLNAGDSHDPLYSHLPRFFLTSRIQEFYSGETREALRDHEPLQELRESLPAGFSGWSPLNRAAYLEIVTLLSGYLLSSQGDRMGMAHGVEGRFPFLDHNLFELSSRLPTSSKLRVLREKDILRRWASSIIPERLAARTKQPYRAPDAASFFGAASPAYVAELLSEKSISDSGIFDPRAVAGLVRRCRSGAATGFRENQALVAILSTEVWKSQMVPNARSRAPLPIHRADVAWDDVVALAV